MARPSSYTDKKADAICQRLMQGEGLITICKDDDMPSTVTVFNWLDKYPEFFNKYVRAREIQAEIQADEILYISDTEEDVNRAKVKIDARKWTASKLKPKKYGSFQQVEMTSTNHTTHSLDPETAEQAVESVKEFIRSFR